MAEQTGEETEQPTQRRLEEAVKQRQFARSAEVQMVFVLGAALAALKCTDLQMWERLAGVHFAVLGHLHDIPIPIEVMQAYWIRGSLVIASLAEPIRGDVCDVRAAGRRDPEPVSDGVRSSRSELGADQSGGGTETNVQRASVRADGHGTMKLLIVIALAAAEVRHVTADPILIPRWMWQELPPSWQNVPGRFEG